MIVVGCLWQLWVVRLVGRWLLVGCWLFWTFCGCLLGCLVAVVVVVALVSLVVVVVAAGVDK